MLKVKILVVGAVQSGKTVLSNFLAEHSETIGGEYRPTQGVRILEFDVNNSTKSRGRSSTIEVELWDCSGDQKYESCWAAMAKDTNGIVFLYNPDQPNQEKDLENWHAYFTESRRLKDSQCLLVTRSSENSTSNSSPSISPVFSKMNSIKSDLEDDPESVRQEFNNFVVNVARAMSEKNEQDELNIMKQS